MSSRPARPHLLLAGRPAFTLIELLVVISIIALLIGILLPALGAARNSARSALSLANQRSNGQAIIMYVTNNRGYFPTSYQYRNANDFFNKTIGGSSSTGYLQWSGIVASEGYFSLTSKAFIDPRHSVEGWAPTNFAATGDTVSTANTPENIRVDAAPPGQTAQSAGVVDTQAPRLSYVPNEMVMPRMKNAALRDGGNMRLARIDEMVKVSGTIMLAEYTDHISAMLGDSITGGAALKTHRPTNALTISGGAKFDGEATAAGYAGTDLTAITYDAAIADIEASKTGASTHHIVYIANDRHQGGGNYAFLDGHGANHKLEDTLNPDDYMWGVRAWTQVSKQAILRPGSSTDTVK